MLMNAFLQIFHYLQGKQDRHALGVDKSDRARLVQMRTNKQMHGDAPADLGELKHLARRYNSHFQDQADEWAESDSETCQQVANW